MSEASAATTRSARQSSCASATQASGPIPAGSPEVTTMRGTYTACARLHLDVDERLVAKPAEPKLGLFVGLALANRGKGLLPAHIVGAVIGAGREHLHDVPAVAGLEGLADLVRLEIRNGLVEFRHERSR